MAQNIHGTELNKGPNDIRKSIVFQLVSFRLANEQYAIDIRQVQEVLRIKPVTLVPQMPSFILGVVNIRGRIISVFDLRKKFNLEEKEIDSLSKFLVLTVCSGQVSFIVDEILDTIKVSEAKIDPAPVMKIGIKRECIKGVVNLENRMIVVLDSDNLHEDILKSIKGK